jgi:nucleotide-binding universal stress UspA family protein
MMSLTVLVCTDGSDLALKAGSIGLSLLRPADTVVVVTVVDTVDPSLADDATGHAGATMTHDEVEAQHHEAKTDGQAIVERTAADLSSDDLSPKDIVTRVLEGAPGPALCKFASDTAADAMIVGSRGRGGIKRALLGSVSDHVVRNAPCSVVVTRATS